ncbi:MAG: AzlC family ABC transporter permease [Clostridia bacterium]|nr:AzlC family ABC transporter permease [Clostridia bacterium]
MTENNSFRMGIRDGVPIFLGYLSVSFAFGIFAVDSGLSIFEALLISMTNLTSAGQLAAVPIICSYGSFIELAVSQLVINLRYSLMSVSLSQKLGKSVHLLHRFLIAFGNTDEIFAVSASKPTTLGRKYFFGLILMPYIGWSSGTLLGAVAGNILPKIVVSALGIAIYGMFIAIIVPEAKKIKGTALCVLCAVAMGCAFKYTPVLCKISDGFVIIICAVSISLIFALLAPVEDKGDRVEEGATE